MKKYIILIAALLTSFAAGAQNVEAVSSKSDFVPFDKVIFGDDLADGKVGEFPSRWDFLAGEECEIVTLDDEKVIKLSGWYTEIAPIFKQADYLPDRYTIEFEVWSNDRYGGSLNDQIRLTLYSEDDSDGIVKVDLNPAFNEVPSERDHAALNYVFLNSSGDESFGTAPGDNLDKLIEANSWLKVQVSYDKGSFKYYVNDVRMVNIPRLKHPTRMRLVSISNCDEQDRFYIRNVRIAIPE